MGKHLFSNTIISVQSTSFEFQHKGVLAVTLLGGWLGQQPPCVFPISLLERVTQFCFLKWPQILPFLPENVNLCCTFLQLLQLVETQDTSWGSIIRCWTPFLDRWNASQLWKQSRRRTFPLYTLLRRKPKPVGIVIHVKAKKWSGTVLPHSRLLIQECFLGSWHLPVRHGGSWEMPHK